MKAALDLDGILGASAVGDLPEVRRWLNVDPELANCQHQGAAGQTPLHNAVLHGHLEVVVELLARGADARRRGGRWGAGAVVSAALSQPASLPFLLEFRQELDIFEAAAIGDYEWVDSLVERQSGLAQRLDENGAQALFYAAASQVANALPGKRGDLVAVAMCLLAHGASPETVPAIAGRKVPPPLYWASAVGNAHMVEALLEHGARLDVPCAAASGSLLHAAAAEGWGEDVVALLLRRGLSPLANDRRKRSACHIALINGHLLLESLMHSYLDTAAP